MKLENEVVQEQYNENNSSDIGNEKVTQSTNLNSESVLQDSTVNEMEKSFTQEAMEISNESTSEENTQEDISNDLKEFGVDSEAPDLFSSDNDNLSSEDLLNSSEEEEEDDLEIPAFLRRQKN